MYQVILWWVKRIHAGTNNCEILIDEQRMAELLENTEMEDIVEVEEKNVDTLFEQIVEEGDGDYDPECDDDDFNFSFE